MACGQQTVELLKFFHISWEIAVALSPPVHHCHPGHPHPSPGCPLTFSDPAIEGLMCGIWMGLTPRALSSTMTCAHSD